MAENFSEMTSSTLKQNLHLRRNETKERMSMSSFIEFYCQNLNSNIKKDEATVFLQLLDSMVASCDISEDETPESQKLINANKFFISIQNRIRNNDYKPSINPADITSYITSLNALKQEADNYDDSGYICDRIETFVSELNSIVTNIYNEEQKKNVNKIILLIIVAAIAFFVIKIPSCQQEDSQDEDNYTQYLNAPGSEPAPSWFLGTWKLEMPYSTNVFCFLSNGIYLGTDPYTKNVWSGNFKYFPGNPDKIKFYDSDYSVTSEMELRGTSLYSGEYRLIKID